MRLCKHERDMYFTCYLSDRTMAVWAVFLTVYKQTRCFQHYALTVVDHYRQSIQHKEICGFFSK